VAAPEVSTILFKLDAGPTQLINSNPTQAAQAFAPRQIQQIEADLQDGLKVVVNLVIEAAGPELLQIMAQGEPLADKVLAQALVADMMDGMELQIQPSAIAPDNKTPASLPASMAALQPTMADEVVAQSTAFSTRPADAAPGPATITLAAAQMQAIAISAVGVPFAIAQYLPASVVVDDREDIFVDRVDPVDGEKHGKGQADEQEEEDQAQAGGDEPKREPPDQPVKSSSEVGSEDADAVSNRLLAGTDGSQLALPRPGPLPTLRDHAHDLYQRMVGWE
jgi:hypothetical protein